MGGFVAGDAVGPRCACERREIKYIQLTAPTPSHRLNDRNAFRAVLPFLSHPLPVSREFGELLLGVKA